MKHQSNSKPDRLSVTARVRRRCTQARLLVLAVLVIVGLLGPSASAAQVEVQGNTGVAYRLFDEIYNAGDMAVANEIISSDAIIHVPGHRFHGAAGCDEFLALLRADFPNAHFTVEDVIVSGDTVAVRWTLSDSGGSATSLFAGDTSVEGMALLRIDNGLIVELWIE